MKLSSTKPSSSLVLLTRVCLAHITDKRVPNTERLSLAGKGLLVRVYDLGPFSTLRKENGR
jgi:hypothetical protein